MAAKKNVWTEGGDQTCLSFIQENPFFQVSMLGFVTFANLLYIHHFLAGHQWFLRERWGAGAHPRVQSRNTHRRGHLPITGRTHDLPMDGIPRGNSVPRLLQPLFRPLHYLLLCPLWVGLMFLGPHFTFPLEGQCRCKGIRCRITFESLQGQRC